MRILRTMAAAGFLALLSGLPAAAQCVERGEGQQMVVQGKVMPFPVAARRAGLRPGDVVAVVGLCRNGGGYVYRVKLRQGGTQSIPAN
jgi:hypothetical protein